MQSNFTSVTTPDLADGRKPRSAARDAFRQEIIAACADMAEEYLEVEREFLSADEELHRAIEYEETKEGFEE